jgi:acetyl esterase/lipase
MKKLARFLAFLSTFFGILILIRSPKGRVGGYVWLPKLWAGAWAPFLASAGALGALIGLARKDVTSMLGGAFGAFAGIRHTVRVTRRKNDPFELAFGRDWEQRIPADLWTRLARPYQLIQPAKPLGLYQKDINIGTTTHLYCDVWLPPPDVPRTHLGVIHLHGSWWQAVDKDFLTRELFGRLVNQGHVVMDVAYSLAPAANIYTMMDEVKQSIVWMKEHAADLDINPERITLMGGSVGGGHLALLAAYTPNFPEFQPKHLKADTSVCAVISMYGITDMIAYFHEYGALNPGQPETSSQITAEMRPYLHDKTLMDRLMTRSRAFPSYRYSNMPGGAALLVDVFGGTLNEIPHIYELFSPITHVSSHCPPTLQIFGSQDFAIDVSQGTRLHRALQSAGIESVYVEFPDTVHAFDQYFGVSRRVAPAAQMAANDIEQFLALMV